MKGHTHIRLIATLGMYGEHYLNTRGGLAYTFFDHLANSLDLPLTYEDRYRLPPRKVDCAANFLASSFATPSLPSTSLLPHRGKRWAA